jgi:2-dehydro-3-deoxygluconokinase
LAFDFNYRPRLWESAEEAHAAAVQFASLSRFVFIGLEEAEALFGGDPLAHVAPAPAQEIVVRSPDGAVTIVTEGASSRFPGQAHVVALDTTGAGDSFDAAYLYARLTGQPAAEALLCGRALARQVVRHSGAIMPRAAVIAGAVRLRW